MAQPELLEAPGIAVDDAVESELLHEATELAQRRRTLVQVDEVDLDAALLEESHGLLRIPALSRAEDLDFHQEIGCRDDATLTTAHATARWAGRRRGMISPLT